MCEHHGNSREQLWGDLACAHFGLTFYHNFLQVSLVFIVSLIEPEEIITWILLSHCNWYLKIVNYMISITHPQRCIVFILLLVPFWSLLHSYVLVFFCFGSFLAWHYQNGCMGAFGRPRVPAGVYGFVRPQTTLCYPLWCRPPTTDMDDESESKYVCDTET